MEVQSAVNGSVEPAPNRFDAINAKIDELAAKLLPPIPHLLHVPTKDPYRGHRAWETNRLTPFETWEFEQLQYMTLVPGDVRGVARPRGGWEDEINAMSPAAALSRSRSGTATPRDGDRDAAKPRAKISLADYKKGVRAKKPDNPATGEKKSDAQASSEKKGEAQVRTRNGDRTSQLDDKADHGKLTQNTSSASANVVESIRSQDKSNSSQRQPESSTANRQATSNASLARSSQNRKDGEPRADSAPLSRTSETPNLKRPLDRSEAPQPEKRQKIEAKALPPHTAGHQRNTSDPMARLFGGGSRSKPTTPKPVASSSKGDLSEVKKSLSSEKGDRSRDDSLTPNIPEMPRLLSPLPEYLTSPNPVRDNNGINNVKADRNRSRSPVKKSDTANKLKGMESTRKRQDDEFALPELLTPDLPPNVEQLLAKSRQPAAAKRLSTSTVQGRHERSRKPDTPGVARKAPKPSAAERRRISESLVETKPEERVHEFLVKIKYKKSLSKRIERLLALKPVPNPELAELTNGIVASKTVPKSQGGKRPRANTVEEKDDSRGGKRPRANTAEEADAPYSQLREKADDKIRRIRSNTADQADLASGLASKRLKVPTKLDSNRLTAPSTPVESAFRSPALAPPSNSRLLDTPKSTPSKLEAPRSATKRMIDSIGPNNALTPQAGSVSTPASTEKPKINGHDPKPAELDHWRRVQQKYMALGTKLKRERDAFFKPELKGNLPQAKQLGCVAGVESLISYIVAFDAADRVFKITGKRNNGADWITLFPLLEMIHRHTGEYLVLDTVIMLLGGIASSALATVQSRFVTEGVAASEMERTQFIREVCANNRRRGDYWGKYQGLCRVLEREHADLMRKGTALSFVQCAGGQDLPIEKVKVEAWDIVREYVKKNDIKWQSELGFEGL